MLCPLLDDGKTSETRSTTPGRVRRGVGGLSPVSYPVRRSSPLPGSQQSGTDVFVKVGDKGGSTTRGRSRRKDDEGQRGIGHHGKSDEQDEYRSVYRDLLVEPHRQRRSNSRQGPNRINGNRQRGESFNSNAGSSSINPHNLGQSNRSCPGGSPRDISPSTSPRSVLRYTIEELRRLRYAPASNRKPSGFHSMIDRAKPSPPLLLCPRNAPRSQQSNSSRTRRTLEPWGGPNPAGTPQRENVFSANEWVRKENDESDSAAISNPSVACEAKEVSIEDPPLTSPQSDESQSGAADSKVEPKKLEREPGEIEEEITSVTEQTTATDEPAAPPTSSVSARRFNQPTPTKSSLGSADVAPFVPRHQQQQQQQPIDSHHSQLVNQSLGLMNPSFVPQSELLGPYVADGNTIPTDHHLQPNPHHGPYDRQYVANQGSSPIRHQQHIPAIELQKDPAISSYGFNPSHQHRHMGNIRQSDYHMGGYDASLGYHHGRGHHGLGWGSNNNNDYMMSRGELCVDHCGVIYLSYIVSGYQMDGAMVGGDDGGSGQFSTRMTNDVYNGVDEDLWDAPIE